MTDRFDELMYIVDVLVDTRVKRHVLGGVLLSVSMLFGGLAVTIITIREERL